MSASALRSAATAAARRLRGPPLSTKAPAHEQESLRVATEDMMRKLKKMKSRVEFRGKVNQTLLVITTPVVAYLAFEIYSMTCKVQKLQKRVEALNST